MCNEYKLRWVDGEWRWIHVGRSRMPVQREQGAFDFNAVREYRYHVFPDRLAPVIRRGKDGELELLEMRWGFPPLQDGGRPIVNVRNLDSPYWRSWLEPRWRCLVPVSEFCEWTDARPKAQRWFKLKEEESFCFAGIWRPWTGTRGTKSNPAHGEHLLFALVTTEANEVVRPIHAQAMPLILPRNEWENWLNAPVDALFAIQRHGFAASGMAEPATESSIETDD